MAEEQFERGTMFWREDTSRIYVLYENGGWTSYRDTWREGVDPTYSCPEIASPDVTPPPPQRGFGKIWCAYEQVRQELGYPTETEFDYQATVQDFEHGSIIRTADDRTYTFYEGQNSDDNRWEKW